MTRPLKKMPTPMGIGAGQTASVNLPRGMTYERLYIEMNVDGTPRDVPVSEWGTYVDEIRLLVDGDARITITAADLVSLNRYYGQAMKPGVLPLFLARPWMMTPNGQVQTAYGTAGGLQSLSLELDLKTGITVNRLQVYAMHSAVPRPFGSHLRIQRYVHNQGVIGQAEISDIMRGDYVMCAMHVTSDNVDGVEVLWGNSKIMETSKTLRAAHADVTDRVPQAGFTHVDFLTENLLAEALPMNTSDFRLRADFTATGNHSIYTESVHTPAA